MIKLFGFFLVVKFLCIENFIGEAKNESHKHNAENGKETAMFKFNPNR